MWVKMPTRKYLNLALAKEISWYFDSGTETRDLYTNVKSNVRTTFAILVDGDAIVEIPLSDDTGTIAPAYLETLEKLIRGEFELWDLSEDQYAVQTDPLAV